MAYSSLAVQTVTASGAAVTSTAMPQGGAGTGVAFVNDGKTFVRLENTGSTGDATFTIVSGGTLGGLDVDDVDVTVGTSSVKFAGPFAVNVFNQQGGTDRNKIQVYVSGTGAADGEIAAFH